MLHIRLCTDRKRNTEFLLHEICTKAQNGIGNQLLLVPEQFSHMTERRLCAEGGDTVSRFAEVLSFSRLAVRVFSEVGGSAETETDGGGRLLIMALAVEQVRAQLKLYGSGTTRPEFLLQLLSALEEFRSFCVDAAQLRKAAGALSGALAVKAEEFALLMESYDAVCANLGQNPKTRLTRLLHALEDGNYAESRQFYFDCFTDFNGVEQEIIAQLLNAGAEVTVNLTCDDLRCGAQQFSVARETGATLQQLALRQGLRPEVLHLEARPENKPLAFLRAHLFGGRVQQYDLPQQSLRFLRAPDSTGECRIAAGQMLQLAAQGVRWRDMAIACADYETYQAILKSVLQRAGIPAYFGGDSDILNQNVVHMLLSALEAATDSMAQAPVLAYIKSGFAPITAGQADCLENYILLWDIDGARWEQSWSMNPAGYHGRHIKNPQELLSELNECRTSAITPLLKLRDGLRRAVNTAQIVLTFNEFINEISLDEKLNTLAQACFKAGQLQKAQEYAQVYEIICRLLEQLYGILGKSARGPEEFYRIFRAAVSRYCVGTIPASLDCVSVGSIESMRRADCSVLFLLGASEGAFPSEQSSTGLLTDNERLRLMDLGVGVMPTCAGRIDRELAAIDSVLCAPREVLYLSAPTDTQAYYLRRAAELFASAEQISDANELISRCAAEYLAYLQQQGRGEASAPPELREQAEIFAQTYATGNLTRETVQALYGQTLRLSASKLDKLAECRYRYFLQYGLGAEERQEAKMDALLFGTFAHAVLEKTVQQTQAEGGFHVVPLERVQEIAGEQMLNYMRENLSDLWDSVRAEYLFRRTFAELHEIIAGLYDELSKSEFIPTWFELRFGRNSALPAVCVPAAQTTLSLEGSVDRVDVFRKEAKTYIRVIDYKSGSKAIEYTKLFAGIGLQMFLYLFALRREGTALLQTPLIPAGVLYFPARIETVSAEKGKDFAKEVSKKQKQALKRSGILLDNGMVLQAMEPCEESPVYLPYQQKNGERTGDLASEEQMRILEQEVFATIGKLGDTLYSGEISANPYYCAPRDNACGYCPYQALCADREYRYPRPIANNAKFWQAIEERRASHE